MKLADLYMHCPSPLQDLVCSAYGARLKRRRYDNDAYKAIEHAILARDSWPAERFHEFCRQRLNSTFKHAANNVPFYRRQFADLGLAVADISCAEELSKIPVLDKLTPRTRCSEFHSNGLQDIPHDIHKTSGTTGAGLVFPMALRAEQEQWATWWRYRNRIGLDRNTWYSHFYGRSIVPLKQTKPPFWRVNSPGKQVLFSAYHMSEQNLPAYITELNRRQTPWIQGYPSLLTLLGSFMLDNGYQLDYEPIAVTVGAESLLRHQREVIEKAFRTRCYQHYGMAEGVGNISECPKGKLHVDEDFGLIEFLPIGDSLYRIVCTGFANPAFPLLRYDVGDIAEIQDGESCDCGLPGRVVTAIDGRREDFIALPDGRKIGRLDHIFKAATHVVEAQIHQRTPGEVTFRLVRGRLYTSADEAALLKEARDRLGSDVHINLSYVDAVERTANGKIRFVVSEIEDCVLEPPKPRRQ